MTSTGKVVLVLIAFSLFLTLGADILSAQERATAKSVKKLPAHERGKVRTYEPGHAFKQPYAVKYEGERAGHPLGNVDTTAEHDVQEGVMFAYGQGWNSLVREMALHVADAANNSKAFFMCNNASTQTACYNYMQAGGVDMNQCEFIIHQMDAVWLRDYGPHFIFDDSVRAVVNSQYYSTRANDNAAPISTAEQLNMALYDIPLMYSGGNYLATTNNHAYMTDLIEDDNPGFGVSKISQIFADYQGVDTCHIFPAFPSSIDGTGHIDMWLCILDDDIAIVGEYPEITPTYQAYVITENATTYLENIGFTVYRVPNHNNGSGGYNGVHYTYTNCFMVNNKMLIICYGAGHEAADRDAELTFTAALPNHEIIPINCAQIIPYSGAMHCICMQVPAYKSTEPGIKLLEPVGGEIWSSDSTRNIRWDADDDVEVTGVDLYLSMDGGVTYPYMLATGEADDGLFEGYDVPYLRDDECRVKAVAHDGDTNTGEDESGTDFTMKKLFTKTYDFSRGDIGVDRYAYGTLTSTWTQVNGQQFPAAVSTPIDQVEASAYDDLAKSDAVAQGSSRRYMNPNGTTNQESTMIVHFHLTELPKRIHSLEILWEGYAQKTQAMEMYIWDYTAGNWGDGKSNAGKDEFIDTVSHKSKDRVMQGRIYENVDRYVEGGLVSLLLYLDPTWYQSNGLDTFHDYISLTVQSLPAVGELTPIE